MTVTLISMVSEDVLTCVFFCDNPYLELCFESIPGEDLFFPWFQNKNKEIILRKVFQGATGKPSAELVKRQAVSSWRVFSEVPGWASREFPGVHSKKLFECLPGRYWNARQDTAGAWITTLWRVTPTVWAGKLLEQRECNLADISFWCKVGQWKYTAELFPRLADFSLLPSHSEIWRHFNAETGEVISTLMFLQL